MVCYFGLHTAKTHPELQNERDSLTIKINQLIDTGIDTLPVCPESAKQYISRAKVMAKDNDRPGLLKNTKLALSKYYAYEKKYDSALYYRELFFNLHADMYEESRNELIEYYSELYSDSVDFLKKELLETDTSINRAKAQTSSIVLIGIICGVVLIILIIVFLVFQRRNMKRINGELKNINKIIMQQRKKILTQNDQLTALNEKIKTQNNIISVNKDSVTDKNNQLSQIFKINDKQNITLTQNISFANQIQTSLLPSNEVLKSIFDDFFVIHKPRELVGGDFYWLYQTNEHIFVVLADCTGHGIPGAFISIFGKTLLDKIIIDANHSDPAEILSLLHEETINALGTDDHDDDFYNFDKLPDDGMDVAICRFSKNFDNLVFAGARRPVYILMENNELIEIKGDKYSIGSFIRRRNTRKSFKYSNHYLDLKNTCLCYLFSDGYLNQMDQNCKKIGSGKLKQLLTENHTQSLNEQKTILENYFYKHMGNQDQIDDTSLLGLKFTTKTTQ